jgi:hypothetical protein
MDAPAQRLLIFAAIMVWLFVSLYRALWQQNRRSPLRTLLLVTAPLSLAVAGLALWLAR